MLICTRCGLPDNFPGIQLNSQGLCNICSTFPSKEEIDTERQKMNQRFADLVSQLRGSNPQGYDALISYSGGKDSTFTLIQLVQEYNLRVLAFTLDNNFLSPQVFTNIHNVVENLGIDHLFLKVSFPVMKKIIISNRDGQNPYPAKALTRASVICNSCMALVKFTALRIALDRQIPLLFYGWSPGQAPLPAAILRFSSPLVRQLQEVYLRPLRNLLGEAINPYFIPAHYFENKYQFPYAINPLAFWNYSEKEIFSRIKQWGWVKPADTDPNSSNCLLNTLAIFYHQRQYGFHPYAGELAELVREGILSREEAQARLACPLNQKLITDLERRISQKQG